MGFQIDPSYKDVAERIQDLKAKHPEASLGVIDPAKPYDIVTIGPKTFIVVTAVCYRTPDDLAPGVGIAWEPFPGPTPYTKDSELQNAQTSAWGRAIVAALASESKAIASLEDVRNRSEASNVQGTANTEPPPEPIPEIKAGWATHEASTAAHDELNNRIKVLSVDQRARASEIRQEVGGGWPLAKTAYETLAAFASACEAFGPDAVPQAADAAGEQEERF